MPTLLVRLEPGHRVFLSNLADFIRPRRQPPLRLISWPAAPWPDIFVSRRLPWRGLFQSGGIHFVIVAALLWLVPLFPQRTVTIERPRLQEEDIVYYSPSDYLPPLDTGKAKAAEPVKGDPAYAPQPIISVPPEADNPNQTIVTPPPVKLDHDVPLPNMVAWTPTPVAVPMAATARTQLQIPSLNSQVVAPAPELNQATDRQAPSLQATVAAPAPEVKSGFQRQAMLAPEPSVVAPPPSMNASVSRRMGEINIGHSDVVAPAPLLPIGEQRTAMARGRVTLASGGGSGVIAPPPSVQGLGSSRGSGQVIALNVRPAAASAAAPIPAGNRRGSFSAGPSGKPDASGTPDIPGATNPSGKGMGGRGAGNGTGAGTKDSLTGVPPGLMVGAAPKGSPTSPVAGGSSDNTLTASITPPPVAPSHNAAKVVLPENATALERKVFGDRRFYSMMLNLPNLNSSGGSWVIRFAEMGEHKEQGELYGPVATQTTDPAYPMELMRKNIQGTVVLYAVIHGDGTVGEVRVLDGVNDRLDEYARQALLRWRFRPASRNGNAVELEAVVRIPFKPFHFKSSF